MKLNNEQIKSITHGVLDLNKDGIVFNRFLKEQYKAFEDEYVEWLIRAKSSAGVSFDFITDSDYFAMRYIFDKGSSKDFGCFDIYIDRVMVNHKHFDITDEYLGFEIPKGEHRVTIYFPWTFETKLNEVYLSDNSIIKEVTHDRKILAIGDSITQGYISEYPSLSYASIVGFDLDVELVNQGIGGYYFNPDSLTDNLNKFNFDLVTLAYGTNDYVRCECKYEFIEHAKSYIDKLLGIFEKDRILAILPIYRADNDYHNEVRNLYKEYKFEESISILKSIYDQYGIQYIEEVGIPHLNEFYAPDGTHPNEFGFQIYGKNVSNRIKKLLNC